MLPVEIYIYIFSAGMGRLFQFIYLIIVDANPIYEYVNLDLILYERYSFVLGIYE